MNTYKQLCKALNVKSSGVGKYYNKNLSLFEDNEVSMVVLTTSSMTLIVCHNAIVSPDILKHYLKIWQNYKINENRDVYLMFKARGMDDEARPIFDRANINGRYIFYADADFIEQVQKLI